MSIVGFNFTKINAERKQSIVGAVNISNNIQISDVTEAKLGIGGDRGAIKVTFKFTSDYAPNLALMVFEGDVLYLVEAKQTQEILDGWKKSKNLPPQLAANVMNHVLDRCNIQALLVSKDLNLPSPVPLPKVQMNIPEEQEIHVAKAVPKETVKTTKVESKKK